MSDELDGITRRELFQIGNVLAMPVLLGGVRAHAEGNADPGPAAPKLGGHLDRATAGPRGKSRAGQCVRAR